MSYPIYATRDGIDAVLPTSALGHLRHRRVVAGEQDLGLLGFLEDDLGVAPVSLYLLADALRPEPRLGGLPLDDKCMVAEEDVSIRLVDLGDVRLL